MVLDEDLEFGSSCFGFAPIDKRLCQTCKEGEGKGKGRGRVLVLGVGGIVPPIVPLSFRGIVVRVRKKRPAADLCVNCLLRLRMRFF